ncbi:MAG: hypothetical protein MJZ22_05830 [Candidatus Saccharibacteria bacterium]|nr:hypothetical protein [Candidatus Saccharibacteria bacterium]
MKHSFESYGLYAISALVTYCVRIKVQMKDVVDMECLRKAVNIATRRFPYFMVKLSIDEDGGYTFEPNTNDIAVLKTSSKNPAFGTKAVGCHFLYVDCEGKNIYFNISHALAGGKGIDPWFMACIYQYVVEKYGVHPNAPAILKPESPLLPGETDEPTIEMTDGSLPYPIERFKNRKSLLKDYLKSIFNPFVRSNEYFEIEFNQKDIMRLAKGNDSSVLSLFCIFMFKTMLKVFPNENQFVGESIHNPASDLGIPHSYKNVLSQVLLNYKKSMKDWDMEKLGTVTRGSLLLQIDPLFSRNFIRREIQFYEEIDKISGLKGKKKYAKKYSSISGSDSFHGTYSISYSGYHDWGEIADYVDSFYVIVDGHQMLEISAIKDKIFCSFMQVIRTDKYINAFKKVLEENGIPYKIQGPFKKNLVKHQIACK